MHSLMHSMAVAGRHKRRSNRLGGSQYSSTDPVARLLFNVLGMVDEFEADLIRMRTREGMAVAGTKGGARGKQPKLSPAHQRHLLTLHAAGEHTQAERAELFSGVSRDKPENEQYG
jgi:DNA invertase Pin-like site-specific DNA recombinase